MAWYRQVRGAGWATPADVKRAVGSASILNDGRAVFNIAGNKYRIVVWINYPYCVVYVRFIGTHRQYDRMRKPFEGNSHGHLANQGPARLS
jgi:mRNA interferase HigB